MTPKVVDARLKMRAVNQRALSAMNDGVGPVEIGEVPWSVKDVCNWG